MFFKFRMTRIARYFLVLTVLGGIIGVVPSESVRAAPLLVTNPYDSGPGSLRQAIENAVPGDTITFDPWLAGRTIGLNSQLLITKNLTIDGSGLNPPPVLSGRYTTRIIEADYPAEVTISGLFLTQGNATNGNGGAVYTTGKFTAINSTFLDNHAAEDGGAIWGGTINVTNSTFSGNQAGRDGGAITSVNLDIRNTTIERNQADHNGGAISIWGDGTTTIVNSTLFHNQAGNSGGGMYLTAYPLVNIFNSTFAENAAVSGYEFTLGTMYRIAFANTIFVCNGESNVCYVSAGNTISYTHSILGIGTLQDYGLANPADNGGPTETMALLPGSPLIEAGNDTICANSYVNNLDQRGAPRPLGSHCDIGAFEYLPFQPSTPTTTATWMNTFTPPATNTPTPSNTPTSTPTAPPTGTATNTPTRTPTYDPTLIPAGDLLRVSVDSDGVQGEEDSYFPAISADGRYIVFNSYASNLVPGDTNGVSDIFVHDMQTDLTTRVSVDSNGMQGNNHSYRPSISADGRYIAFDSSASNLVVGDTNGNTDIFVHDRQTGLTRRVSVRSNGSQGFGTSLYPSVSADGRYIAFYSSAPDLAANDTNLANDVFVHDMQTGETGRISTAFDGTQADHDSRYPSISADGRYIAFESEATTLIPGDTNGVKDVFRYDRLTGQILRVSVDSSERQANGYSGSPSISADGSLIAFESLATNLVSDDTNPHMDIILHDASTGATTPISVDPNGLQPNNSCFAPSISGDGRYIAFDSAASNLVPEDENRQNDAFVYDRGLGKTTRFSVSSIYGEGNGQSSQIVVSADGQFLAFASWATNLVPYDTNLGVDVFVYRQTIAPLPLTPTPTLTRTGTPTSTATKTLTPTQTSRTTASPTHTATATQTPTATASPTQLPTSTPTMVPASYARTTTGVFRPSNGLLYLKNTNDTGFADATLNYGLPGDYPVVGDWDGDGDTTIGIYRNGKFMLRNSNTVGFADMIFAFGQPGDQPVAGDWDGDGTDTIGVYRPSTGQFLLRNSNSAGEAEMGFYLGNVGDVGIAGDWDGDGKDTTGVFRPINGIIFLKNTNETGYADLALNYGIPGDMPVTGDWDNDGIDTIGVYRNGQFLLRNSNTVGFADLVFGLGISGDMPIAGNWDGRP